MLPKAFLGDLVSVLVSIRDKSDMEDFLQGILTPKEIQELSIRLQIIKQLKQGKRQRDISDNLGVGIATVTRGSRELRKGRFKTV